MLRSILVGAALVVVAPLVQAQQVALTYVALKTTTDYPPAPDKDAMVTLTLASGAWVKIRATEIDYDRTSAYKRVAVIKAETTNKGIDAATKRDVFTMGFSRRYAATVWLEDVDFDVMRSGFTAYHQAHGDAGLMSESPTTGVKKCEKDWPDDFRMQDYCQTKQRESYSALQTRKMSSPDERTVRTKCATDWPDDYAMRNYCEEEQLKALARIRR